VQTKAVEMVDGDVPAPIALDHRTTFEIRH
jgi:hypothetical protein